MGPKISIKVDGKNVDLEDAFEVFEGMFEDMDETFKHMEKTFKNFDSNIKSKLEKVKRKVAAENSDKYEYIPDDDEDAEQFEYYKQRALLKTKAAKNLRMFIMFMMISLLTLVAILFGWVIIDGEKEAELGAPTKAPVVEKLEKL